MGPPGMSAMEQLHDTGRVPPGNLGSVQDLLPDLLSDPGGTSSWWGLMAEVSPERHTSEDHRRCGLCGELTQADLCCGQEV